MNYIKDIQVYLEDKYRLMLPIIVLMSFALQFLYLFPDSLSFFSINQILIDGIMISLVCILLLLLFSFLHFLGFTLFKGSYFHKIFNFIALLIVIYFIMPNNDFASKSLLGIIASTIGGFMGYTGKDFKSFFKLIILFTILLTPVLTYTHKSFSVKNTIVINGTNYNLRYFNSDYFFIEDGSIFDRDGNKFIKSP